VLHIALRIARTLPYADSGVEHLNRVGADAVIMEEREIASGMIEQSFQRSIQSQELDQERREVSEVSAEATSRGER
jgi:hypothetical protein